MPNSLDRTNPQVQRTHRVMLDAARGCSMIKVLPR